MKTPLTFFSFMATSAAWWWRHPLKTSNSSTVWPLDGGSARINIKYKVGWVLSLIYARELYIWIRFNICGQLNCFYYDNVAQDLLHEDFSAICINLLSLTVSCQGMEKTPQPKAPLDMEIKTYCFWWLRKPLGLHRWHFLYVCVLLLWHLGEKLYPSIWRIPGEK